METITLAGGCFWCTEAIFLQLKGVEAVVPGYSGGDAESVQITFDPKVLRLEDLLYVFFKLHDPTTLNRQGADVGTQYRSAIFWNSNEQKLKAEKGKQDAQKYYKDPIVTEITKYNNFYPADPSQKEYYFKHRLSPYCLFVIDPKINKLKKEFKKLLK
jgi:peptide-methionine (S)-S-oxide reductase